MAKLPDKLHKVINMAAEAVRAENIDEVQVLKRLVDELELKLLYFASVAERYRNAEKAYEHTRVEMLDEDWYRYVNAKTKLDSLIATVLQKETS